MGYFSRVTKLASLIFSLALLSACGGGSSSSDAPSGNNVFTGTQQITISGNGVNEVQTEAFFLTLDGDSIFITDNGNPPLVASGTQSNFNFTASGNPTATIDGISCTFNVTYTGTLFLAGTSNGNISGNAVCSDNGTSLTFSLSGTFTGNNDFTI